MQAPSPSPPIPPQIPNQAVLITADGSRLAQSPSPTHRPPIAPRSPGQKFPPRSPSENVENILNLKVDGGEWCHDAMTGIEGDTSVKLETWGGCGRTTYRSGTLGWGTEPEPCEKRLKKHSAVTARCNKVKSSKAKKEMYRSASSLLPHEGMNKEHFCQERDCVHRPRSPTRPPTAGSSTNVHTHSMQRDS